MLPSGRLAFCLTIVAATTTAAAAVFWQQKRRKIDYEGDPKADASRPCDESLTDATVEEDKTVSTNCEDETVSTNNQTSCSLKHSIKATEKADEEPVDETEHTELSDFNSIEDDVSSHHSTDDASNNDAESPLLASISDDQTHTCCNRQQLAQYSELCQEMLKCIGG